jgi:hypothetical protein
MAEINLYRVDAKAGQLPEVCVYSGQPATHWQRRMFLGSTPFTIFGGRGIPDALLPISERFQGRALRRNIVRLVMLLAFVGCVVVLARMGTPNNPGPWAAWMEQKAALSAAALGLFAGTVVLHCYFYYTDVRCVYLDHEVMTLKGVSPEFAAAYDEAVSTQLA